MSSASTSLDKRLRELEIRDVTIWTPSDAPHKFIRLNDQAIEAIKQAFIDEGWVQPDEKLKDLFEDMQILTARTQKQFEELKQAHGYVYTKPDELKGVMTGPEWLARFEKELEQSWPTVSPTEYHAAKAAARRAAGVDE